MNGLHIVTEKGLLDVVGPLMDNLADHVWIVQSSYAAFLWPGNEDDAPKGFRENVTRIDTDICAYSLNTASMFEFANLMTLDWVEVIALAPGTDPALWWKKAGAGRRGTHQVFTPAQSTIKSDAHLYARRIDGAFWDVFCRDTKWLEVLRRHWPNALAVALPPECGVGD